MTDIERIEAALAAIPGLTFGHCKAFFARQQGPELMAYAHAARVLDHEDCVLEFDEPESTIVSAAENGAYVLGWAWVSAEVLTDDYAENMPEQVWVLVIEHRYGANTYVNRTKAGSDAALHRFVIDWWPEIRIRAGDMPKDPEAAIALYFEAVANQERYTQAETTLNP